MFEHSLEVFSPIDVKNPVWHYHFSMPNPQSLHHSFINKVFSCTAVDQRFLFGLAVRTYKVKWYMYCTDFTNIHDTQFLRLNPGQWIQAP